MDQNEPEKRRANGTGEGNKIPIITKKQRLLVWTDDESREPSDVTKILNLDYY